MKKRNRVFQKIKNDYNAIKKEMLLLEPQEVFENAYKIYCINEFYYILTNSYDYSTQDVVTILNFKGNFLEQLYYEWLDVDSSSQDELVYVIDGTFSKFCEVNRLYA